MPVVGAAESDGVADVVDISADAVDLDGRCSRDSNWLFIPISETNDSASWDGEFGDMRAHTVGIGSAFAQKLGGETSFFIKQSQE